MNYVTCTFMIVSSYSSANLNAAIAKSFCFTQALLIDNSVDVSFTVIHGEHKWHRRFYSHPILNASKLQPWNLIRIIEQ